MPLLSDEEIDAALATLPGWSRQGDRLVRDVPVADDAAERLTADILRVADEMDHHPVVERTATGLRLLVWSHDSGGITRRDPRLAARLAPLLD